MLTIKRLAQYVGVTVRAAMAERLVGGAQAAGVASAEWTEAGQLSGDEQALLAAHVDGYSPAWRRLMELVSRRVQEMTPSP
jgi:hypothetical protein